MVDPSVSTMIQRNTFGNVARGPNIDGQSIEKAALAAPADVRNGAKADVGLAR
jgi:hypothetical protein